MATPSGPESASLAQQLQREAYRFEFFQAVRILERLYRETAGNDAPRDPSRGDGIPFLARTPQLTQLQRYVEPDPVTVYVL